MILFFKGNYEKIVTALTAGALLLSLVSAWRQHRELQALAGKLKAETAPAGGTYAPALWRVPGFDQASWGKAPEQSAGAGWLYELFTPPAISYSSDTHAFAVAAPRTPAPRGGRINGRPALVAKAASFPLQLTGYFGTPGNYLVALVSPESGETLLARVGRRFPQSGLTLTSFEVQKVPVEHAEPWPVYDVVGLATLRDEHTGTEIVLDTRARKRSDNPGAGLDGSPPAVESPSVTVAGQTGSVSDFSASSESGRSQ